MTRGGGHAVDQQLHSSDLDSRLHAPSTRNSDLTARHTTGGHHVRFPHQYVAQHVELDYATTPPRPKDAPSTPFTSS